MHDSQSLISIDPQPEPEYQLLQALSLSFGRMSVDSASVRASESNHIEVDPPGTYQYHFITADNSQKYSIGSTLCA